MNTIQVGILGLGTVGGGTVNVLTRNANEIARRAGRPIRITRAAVRSLTQKRICDLSGISLTTNPEEIIQDPDIQIVVELIGGDTVAKELVLSAIRHGKHVVTANKALIARHGDEIFSLAESHGVMVAFEAAVAGGIPIIKAIREGLAGNQIQWVVGIINGTSNFILTEMRDKGRSFAEVLTEAQSLGYAEADPAFDVEGIDAAHKLTILAAIAFGIPLQYKRVYTEGITQVTSQDIAFAEQLGYRIKHLGIARRTDQGIELRVHPTLIPAKRIIANVDGVMNAVLVKGDAVGHTLFYGAGAGADPTGSAVVADIIDVARALTADPENRVPHLAFQPSALTKLPILPMGQTETAYYLRLHAEDRPGVLADITKILGDSGISIEAILQKERIMGETHVPVILLTQRVQEAFMVEAIGKIEQLPAVRRPIARLRLESLV
ncbi:Homoserine dehydrogenase [Gammaproteobacteria bacterium]